MKYISLIYIIFLSSHVCHADLWDERVQLRKQVQEQEGETIQARDLRKINGYTRGKVARFGKRHKGYQITNEQMSYATTAGLILRITFSTGDGLACQTAFSWSAVECIDGSGHSHYYADSVSYPVGLRY